MDHDIDIHPRHKVILLLVIAVLCLLAFGVIATATSLPKLNWALVLFLFGLLFITRPWALPPHPK